jgi:hypothetical protein
LELKINIYSSPLRKRIVFLARQGYNYDEYKINLGPEITSNFWRQIFRWPGRHLALTQDGGFYL